MRQYGLNILAHSVNDFGALDSVMATLKPAAIVVMDEPKLSQKYARLYPSITVIHRAYNERDHEWHTVTTPRAWLDTHAPLATDSIVLQLYNEPLASPPVIKFIVETMALAAAQNIRLCVANFAVGNPHEDAIIRGDYDDLLRAFDKYPQHVFGLHEYFRDTPETPYYIGRFRFWLQRAQLLGLRTPRIIVTEFGRDLGGGARDGWRAQGWSEQDYFNRLEEARKVYALHNIPMCVYCYGRGAGDRWMTFDVQQSGGLIRRMTDANNAAQTTTPPPAPLFAKDALIAIVPAEPGTNVRPTPAVSKEIVVKLNGTGAIQARYLGEQITGDEAGRRWVNVRIGEGDTRFPALTGWVATDAVRKLALWNDTLSPPPVVVPPDDTRKLFIQLPEIALTEADKQRLIKQVAWSATAPNLDDDVKTILASLAIALSSVKAA